MLPKIIGAGLTIYWITAFIVALVKGFGVLFEIIGGIVVGLEITLFTALVCVILGGLTKQWEEARIAFAFLFQIIAAVLLLGLPWVAFLA